MEPQLSHPGSPARLPSNRVFMTLLIITVVATIAWFVPLGGYLGRLIVSGTLTLVHLVLALWCLAKQRNDSTTTPTKDPAMIIGILGLIAGLSWGSWAIAAWEEYVADQALPIINIFGLLAFAITPTIIIIGVVTAPMHRRIEPFLLAALYIAAAGSSFYYYHDDSAFGVELRDLIMMVLAIVLPFTTAVIALAATATARRVASKVLLVCTVVLAAAAIFTPYALVGSAGICIAAGVLERRARRA